MSETLWSDERIEAYNLGMATEREHQNALSRLSMAKYEARIAELTRELDEVTTWWQTSMDRCANVESQLVALRGDDWAATVDYLISLAPEPEPTYDAPEPPEDYNDEDNPHYDTPGGY